MASRRDFLKSSAAAICAFATAKFATAGQLPQLGAQLYTVCKEAEEDLPGLLGEIHAIGYQQVETYWNVYTHPARELRQMILDAGLDVPSGHFDYAGLDGKFEYARELGVKFMVCPMLPTNMQHSLSAFQRAADQFNRWGEKARSIEMQFAFHNHNYEFRRFGQTTGLDTLIERTDPKLVSFELDCYWIAEAGQDPAAIMRKLGKRVRMLHLKDLKSGFPPSQDLNAAAEHFTEVGKGTVDWKRVFDAARESEVEYKFVEQDKCERTPLESLRISYRNTVDIILQTMGVIS